MATFNIGLVRGRHEMPVTNYVWDEIPDVLDFSGMEYHAMRFIGHLADEAILAGKDEEVKVYGSGFAFPRCRIGAEPVELNLYVTGLTAATVAVVNAAIRFNRDSLSTLSSQSISLTLYHFDRESGKYRPQYCSIMPFRR